MHSIQLCWPHARRNRLHLCVLRADIRGLIEHEDFNVASRAEVHLLTPHARMQAARIRAEIRKLLGAPDSYGHSPIERAYDLFRLSRDQQMGWLLRLWLVSWFCLAATSDDAGAGGTKDAGGIPLSLLDDEVLQDVLNVELAPREEAGATKRVDPDAPREWSENEVAKVAAAAVLQLLVALPSAEKRVQLIGRVSPHV